MRANLGPIIKSKPHSSHTENELHTLEAIYNTTLAKCSAT